MLCSRLSVLCEGSTRCVVQLCVCALCVGLNCYVVKDVCVRGAESNGYVVQCGVCMICLVSVQFCICAMSRNKFAFCAPVCLCHVWDLLGVVCSVLSVVCVD